MRLSRYLQRLHGLIIHSLAQGEIALVFGRHLTGYVSREPGGSVICITAAQLDTHILQVLLRGIGIVVDMLIFKHDVLQNVVGLRTGQSPQLRHGLLI